jgi:hypothetical protein
MADACKSESNDTGAAVSDEVVCTIGEYTLSSTKVLRNKISVNEGKN